MAHHRSIRRAQAASDVTLRGVAILFWVLFVVALAAGGRRAAESIPSLTHRILPQGLIAAQAVSEGPSGTVAMVPDGRAEASPFGPETLTPVVAHAVPGWLSRSAAGAFVLRGTETSSDPAMVATPSLPAIAIVIDDLGSDAAATRRTIRLPASVSLSFLPYPDATPMLAREAQAAGHQVLAHVPMEPEGRDDPGPNALLTDLNPSEIARRVSWALERVPGYSGINNHMGSRFTAVRAVLMPVVELLAERHVFFLDSRTTPKTVVVPLAHEFGVASAGRDVFLDDNQTVDSVDAQLAVAEHVARTQGIAIAIGHPHAATLEALEGWLAHLRSFALVNASTAIRLKTERAALARD